MLPVASLTPPHLHSGPPSLPQSEQHSSREAVSPVMASPSANLEGVPGVALESWGHGGHAADVWGCFSALASMIAPSAF